MGTVIIHILVLILQSMFQWIVQERIVDAKRIKPVCGISGTFSFAFKFSSRYDFSVLHWLQYLLGISFGFGERASKLTMTALKSKKI